jgi:hypothetical protein
MRLLDLRKLAIKKQQRIRFRLKNGMECVMNEVGVAHVPGLDRVPDFNLEQELEAASVFVLEPLDTTAKNAPKPRTVAREEMLALVSATPSAAHHDERDDE